MSLSIPDLQVWSSLRLTFRRCWTYHWRLHHKFKTWLIKKLSLFKLSLPMPMVIHCWIVEDSLLIWLTQNLKPLSVKTPQIIIKCLSLSNAVMIPLIHVLRRNLFKILLLSLKVERSCLRNWQRHTLCIHFDKNRLTLGQGFTDRIKGAHMIPIVLDMIMKIVLT